MLIGFLHCAGSITEKQANSAAISYDIAVSSLAAGDTRAALKELLHTVSIHPKMPEAYNALGLVYHQMNQLDKSMDSYNKAIALNPMYSDAYNNKGALLTDLAKYDEAIESFKKALSDILYETPSLAMGNLGWAYYQKGQIQLALQTLENSVAVDSRFCRGYEWLIQIGSQQKQYALVENYGKKFQKNCVENIQISKSLSPHYIHQVQKNIAMSYIQQGKKQEAKQVFLQCSDRLVDEGVEADCYKLFNQLK